MADEMRPCPEKNGKPCVELFPVRTKEEMCLGHLCGITDAIPISRIIGVDMSDLIVFHNTVVKAAKNKS
jgi:hypothetical protein